MKQVTPEVNFKELDEGILAAWKSHKTFEKQNEQRKDAQEFCFNDGPPFANGLPHYGHLLANTIKDVVPRYWVMKGFHVDRRFGWDCHGLPVEFEIEKKHELRGRPDILDMGIDKFNGHREVFFTTPRSGKRLLQGLGVGLIGIINIEPWIETSWSLCGGFF